jgi:2,4-dienoyl-CoA reductase-like NADH-dependent reductase (Old Yellow Enzyme family)
VYLSGNFGRDSTYYSVQLGGDGLVLSLNRAVSTWDEESKLMAQMLEKEGASVLHVSGSMAESILNNHSKMCSVQPMCVPRGCFVHLAEGIKKAVTIPVIAVGRINDPSLADQILAEGKADLIAMGRALIADPYLPFKARKGSWKTSENAWPAIIVGSELSS